MSDVKIKICGITNLDDARAAIACGATWLGLIFAKESPRKITLEQAKEVIDGITGRAAAVGVFKNDDPREINKYVARLGLDLVQLHGSESVSQVQAISVPVIKAIELSMSESRQPELNEMNALISAYSGKAAYLLFDRPKTITSDTWLKEAITLIQSWREELPDYFIAGGLTKENLPLVLTDLHPMAVDVASGVESTAGRKDLNKLKAFCDTVRSFQASISNGLDTSEVGRT